jgi:rubrerythrin
MEKYYRVSDVNALVEKLLREPYYQHNDESWYSGVSAMADALLLIAPTFIEEPKVGKWEKRTWITFDSEKTGFHCSECNTTWDSCTKFCPNCGAKMIEEN